MSRYFVGIKSVEMGYSAVWDKTEKIIRLKINQFTNVRVQTSSVYLLRNRHFEVNNILKL